MAKILQVYLLTRGHCHCIRERIYQQASSYRYSLPILNGANIHWKLDFCVNCDVALLCNLLEVQHFMYTASYSYIHVLKHRASSKKNSWGRRYSPSCFLIRQDYISTANHTGLSSSQPKPTRYTLRRMTSTRYMNISVSARTDVKIRQLLFRIF